MKYVTTLIFITLSFSLSICQEVVTETYEYDDVGRLVKASYDNSSEINYSYDPSGNIINLESKVDVSNTEEIINNKNIVLFQNTPNPSRSLTTIKYYLPKSSQVELILFSNLGQKIKILDSGYKNQGFQEINLFELTLPPGVYNYQLKVDNTTLSKKMILF